MFVRNGARSVRRAIDSVLAQTYPNIEFVVQDGASSDGTLDILASYGDRLKLKSEPDSGPDEAYMRAMVRCQGEIIGSCLADEELLPDAVERAVRVFQAEPAEIGALTGDALLTDIGGNVTGSWTSGPFNLVDYLTADYSPYLVSSFFRHSALRDIGLTTETWCPHAVEFDLWCRLATRSSIKYVPGAFAKYASHPAQMSNTPRDMLPHLSSRMEVIDSLCAPGGFFDDNPFLRSVFIWGHARVICNHAITIGKPEMAREEYRIMMEALAPYPAAFLDGVQYDADFEYRRAALAAWSRAGKAMPGVVRLGLGLPAGKLAEANFVDRLVKRRYRGSGSWPGVLKTLLFSGEAQGTGEIRTPPPPDRMLKARLYAEMARSYEKKGRAARALESWQFAAVAAGIYIPDDELLRADRKQGWKDAKAQ
jgi:glycosyltransferase involved in cell wall biosynthesis